MGMDTIETEIADYATGIREDAQYIGNIESLANINKQKTAIAQNLADFYNGKDFDLKEQRLLLEGNHSDEENAMQEVNCSHSRTLTWISGIREDQDSEAKISDNIAAIMNDLSNKTGMKRSDWVTGPCSLAAVAE